MRKDVEERAAEVLRRESEPAVSVERLHGALVAECGPGVGSCGDLGGALRRRPDLFVVLAPADPIGGTAAWPADVRAEYETALRTAGVNAGARVALREAAPSWPEPNVVAHHRSDTSIARIEASLVALWRSPGADDDVRACIAEALREAERIRQALEM